MVRDGRLRIALVCGGAAGVWGERAEAVRLLEDAGAEIVSIAVNGAGAKHPDPLEHWATLHPEDFRERKGWEGWREVQGLGGDYVRWSSRRHPDADRTLRGWSGGSSGLFGVGVALEGLACDAVALAGVHLAPTPNVTDPQWADGWEEAERFRYEWEKKRTQARMGGRVRSMGGWTRDLLGRPTAEWLRETA